MAKVVAFPVKEKLTVEEQPRDPILLATLYAMRWNALDEGDLELASEIDEEVRTLMNHPID